MELYRIELYLKLFLSMALFLKHYRTYYHKYHNLSLIQQVLMDLYRVVALPMAKIK